MIEKNYKIPNKEIGAITLLVSIMMLIIITLMTLYTHRSVIAEQRSASNEFKQVQALEAAQSGIDQFLGKLKTADPDAPGKSYLFKYFNPPDPTASDYKKTNYSLKPAYTSSINAKNYLSNTPTNTDTQHSFTNDPKLKLVIDDELPQPKLAADTIEGTVLKQTYSIYLSELGPNRFQIVSRGCADDCAYAEAVITREISISEGLTCAVEFNKNLNVIAGAAVNGFTNGVAGMNCGNAVATVSGSDTQVAGCVDNCLGANADYWPNNNPGKNYHKADTQNSDDLFKKYFDQTLAEVKADTAKTCVLTGNITLPLTGATNTPFAGCSGTEETIVITGNLTIPYGGGGGPLFFGVKKSLVIAGDLNMSGGTTLNMQGFLFVKGKFDNKGSLTILGNASFAGDVNNEVTINVTADATKSRLPKNAGPKSDFRSGSWRDF